MITLPDELLSQLIDLINRLRSQAPDFLQHPDRQQDWYNRGYANGMVSGLRELLATSQTDGLDPDDPAQLDAHRGTPWLKAYRHGEETGRRETLEISGAENP